MLRQFWNDEGGAVVTPEVCIIGVILVIGLVVGISAVQDAMRTEIDDVGEAIESMDFTPTLGADDDELEDQQLGPQSNHKLPVTASDVLGGE